MSFRESNHILLITHSRDFYVIDRVMDALRALGAHPVRLDTDRFPGHLRAGLLGQGPESFFECTMDLVGDLAGTPLSGRSVGAVWTRSIWPPAGLDEVDPAHRRACENQSRNALEALFDSLCHAHWMNDWRAIVHAGNKARQLRVAAAAGLNVPATLITNDPDRVRRFYDTHKGDIVTKLLAGLGVSMDRSAPFMPTSAITRDDLDRLDSLRLAPMIFQKRMAKAEELRIAFVDGQCFVGSIRAPAGTGADWRLSDVRQAPWQPGALPDTVQARLRDFMARMGLQYGAVDIIVTPGGDHVFLEVNPLGEWGMLERDLDLPICQSVARALLARSRKQPRVHEPLP